MSRIVNSYTIRPGELKPGDVMVCTVTLHVMSDRTYRMYQCLYVDPRNAAARLAGASLVDGVPQGSRIYDDGDIVAQQLFPTALNAGLRSDEY